MAHACAVFASESKDVDFFVSITSVLVEGYKDTLYIKESGVKEKFKIYNKLFCGLIKDSTFIFNGVNYKKTEKIANQCFNATIDSIVRRIYEYGKFDLRIPRWTSETVSKLWQGTKFDSTEAKPGISNYSMVLDSIICKFAFSKPNVIALYQWQPAKYYSKITIPTYICFGQDDKMINTRDNYNSALDLKKSYCKNNFQIEIFPDLGHNLSAGIKSRNVVTFDKNSKPIIYTKNSYVMDSEAIDKVVMWINKISE
jgi:hypothetical protein